MVCHRNSRNGGMVDQNGRMVEWWNGGMVEWWNGGMVCEMAGEMVGKERRNGRMTNYLLHFWYTPTKTTTTMMTPTPFNLL